MHERIFELFRHRLRRFYTTEFFKMYPESIPLEGMCAVTKEPVPFRDRLKLSYSPVKKGDVWGHEWDNGWFHFTVTVPKSFEGKELCLRINTGGESCIFDESGCPIYGLTPTSVFDDHYFKDRFLIGRFNGGDKLDYWVESTAFTLGGITLPKPYDENPPKPQGSYDAKILTMELCVFDRDMHALVTDMHVLPDLLDTYGKNDFQAKQLLRELNKALDIYNYNLANAGKACSYLKEHSYRHHATDRALKVCCIGHSHIDIGWLWPVRESIRKAARTFSSQLALMEKYPQYLFGASQAELYKMTKDNYPALYEKIKQRIKDGRWEVQGGMWVEADCNLISGESMVRQLLHGKNFFMDEFGVDVRSVWLPDVFGYSASMPQIMLKAGCDYFLTQKLSWSQVNTFPYSSFRWSGIDGSEVLVHFPPENNYNSNCCPSMRKRGADNFQEAGIADEFMSLFGIGDGGGGPSEDYVERNERVKDLEGCPKAAYGKSADFFNRLDKIRNELPIWKGELYLEIHRGTLTTQARTKRNNRKCEQALQQLEALASLLPTHFYPESKLDMAWKSLLVNQFHDILPGSAIREVYETTEKQHAAILEMCRSETETAARLLFKENAEAAVVANTLSCPWRGCIELPCDWAGFEIIDDNGKTWPSQLEGNGVFVYIETEGLSFLMLRRGRKKATAAVVAQPDGTGLVLENGIVRYTFNDQGQLVSAVDLREDREILTDAGNILSLYHDRPFHFEAWEVDIFYPRDVMGTLPCVKAEGPFCGEVRSTLTFTYRTEASTVVQTVSLAPHSTRLDFITHADWHESRMMLRASFPVAISSNEATFDIQYGYVRRPTHDNTSWEQAKFEAVGQRYADLSQDDYGTALLNDCKYGYRMKGSVMDINLLRSPRYPDYNADQGEHDFVYSFYPHTGDHVAGNVAEVSAMLNRPPVVAVGFEANNVEFPCHVVAGHASIETLKKAEKDDSHIVRIVETAGRHGNVALRFAQEVKRVSETNLLEWEHGRELQMNERIVSLKMKPFEIVTLRIE